MINDDRIDRIIDNHRGEASSLIQVLLDIQSEDHWLSKEALSRVSEKLDVPLRRILHIATFYKAFSLEPRGKYVIQVCLGTACHLRGGPQLAETIRYHLGIGPGETTADGLFTLETVNCLGACALAPVMVVGKDYHRKIKPERVARILGKYRKGQ